MKKIFTFIFAICVVAIANAQTFRTIDKDFEIVKPVKLITDEKGKEYITKEGKEVYVHLQQFAVEGKENYIHFWIEINDNTYHFHSVEGRILELSHSADDEISPNDISYFVEDDYYSYCHIFYNDYLKIWSVDLQTKKDEI